MTKVPRSVNFQLTLKFFSRLASLSHAQAFTDLYQEAIEKVRVIWKFFLLILDLKTIKQLIHNNENTYLF